MESKRIHNLKFKKATYLGNEPENPSWEIAKYEPNSFYGKEDYFVKEGDHYRDPERKFIRLHANCFKNKETCYSIAMFNYNKKDGDYEIEFVADRPLELNSEEWNTFKELLSYGYSQLNEKEYEN